MPELVMTGPDGRPRQPGTARPGTVPPGKVLPGPGQPGPVPPRPWRPQPRPLLRTLVGDVLRRTRLAQRRTLADVARAARVSVPYLSELERGRKEASSEVLAAICEALRIGLPGLLAEVGRDLAPRRQLAPRPDLARPDLARPDLAGEPGPVAADARIIRLGTAGGRRISPQMPRSGDAQCLLAA